MPVIKYFTALGKVAEVCVSQFSKTFNVNRFQIDSSGSIEEVYEKTKSIISDLFQGSPPS